MNSYYIYVCVYSYVYSITNANIQIICVYVKCKMFFICFSSSIHIPFIGEGMRTRENENACHNEMKETGIELKREEERAAELNPI